MEPPATFEADALRDEKVKVIRAIGELTPERDPRPTSFAASTARAGSAPSRSRATARSRRSTPSPRPRRTSPPASRSTTGAGPACPSTCGPASASRSGRPRSRSSSRRSPTGCSSDSATDPDPNLLAIRIQPDEGIMLRFGAKVPGPRDRRPLGEHGLHLRLGLLGRLARRLRDADPRRPARRRLAVHPGRRGRGRLGDRHADHRAVGERAGHPSSRTTRPAPGAPTPPTSCWLARADDGDGSEPSESCRDRRREPPRDDARPPRTSPSSAGGRGARSIEGIEQELARIWAQPDLNAWTVDGDDANERHVARPDQRDEPRRHRPAGRRSASAARRRSSGSPVATRRGRLIVRRPIRTARRGSMPRSTPTA